jgi:hypothetical protein
MDELLKEIFIPGISNLIADYCIGYDKQIEKAHNEKKKFNTIMKFIFNRIRTKQLPWCPDFGHNLYNYGQQSFGNIIIKLFSDCETGFVKWENQLINTI